MEPTGLDAFKGLLGRLNGKSDVELKKEERKRDDVRLARYAALKFPEVRFVSGGLLAQEQKPEISPPIPKEEALTKSNTEKDSIDRSDSSSSESDTPVRKTKMSKSKSKSEKDRSGSQETELKKEKREKKEKKEKKETKKSKKRKAEDEPTEIASQTAPEVKATPTVSGERRPIGRNVFRSRYIAQKKKALMDDKSLNEVRLTLPGFYERC
jgi:Pin2-interacting protein X1